jgi:hypothetical protein
MLPVAPTGNGGAGAIGAIGAVFACGVNVTVLGAKPGTKFGVTRGIELTMLSKVRAINLFVQDMVMMVWGIKIECKMNG